MSYTDIYNLELLRDGREAELARLDECESVDDLKACLAKIKDYDRQIEDLIVRCIFPHSP